MTKFKKKELDDWLNEINYSELNSNYIPSQFSLMFLSFIKLVNGKTGETHETPPVHLKMLDKLASPSQYIVNLCFRGMAKTTLFMEYLCLYIAVFGELPHLGSVDSIIYVSDTMENGVRSAKNNIQHRYDNSDFLKKWIPKAKFIEGYIEFENTSGKKLGIKMYGAATGIRGTKIFGKRPTLAILDDLIGDKFAESKASMQFIKDTVYKGVFPALDPTKRKIIFNGTPFNKEDIIIEAVESGAWDANVWPVCEKFPCTKKEFVSAWPDRFTYEFVKSQYDMAVKTGNSAAFFQEYMLRITPEEERIVPDRCFRWVDRKTLMERRSGFNFYITTDFATSAKQTADNTVIGVWAYNNNGDWFLVDGICKKQTMNKTIDDLFAFVSKYRPQSVGIEVSGQQGAFISWLQKEMALRNIWFNFATQKNGAPGLRPIGDKLSRFNLVVPWFTAGKIFFCNELKDTPFMNNVLGEIRLVTASGIKGKDDCLDMISMLGSLNPWKPSAVTKTESENVMWEHEDAEFNTISPLSSYIV